jgi:hypothetical protein
MATWTEPTTSVESYLSGLSDFARPIALRLRELITTAAPQLEEDIRWNAPSYKGRLLICSFTAFQKHVLLTFPRGAELADPKGLLVNGQGKTSIRSMKITDIAQVETKLITAWVKAAVKLDKAGPPVANRTKDAPKEIPIPEPLAEALSQKNNDKARSHFEALSYASKREYCEWISSVKQEETIKHRLAVAMVRLRAGEALKERYTVML